VGDPGDRVFLVLLGLDPTVGAIVAAMPAPVIGGAGDRDVRF